MRAKLNFKKFSSFISHFSSRKGFTLIELLIVIAILGVLAAAVFLTINPGQRIASAKNVKARQDLVAMGKAANLFSTDISTVEGCAVGQTYPNDFGVTICGVTYMARPTVSSEAYTYTAQTSTGTACTAVSPATACAKISISSPAFTDGTVDASANTVWCWRSIASAVTQVADIAACTP